MIMNSLIINIGANYVGQHYLLTRGECEAFIETEYHGSSGVSLDVDRMLFRVAQRDYDA